jgi:hypothetical protein
MLEFVSDPSFAVVEVLSGELIITHQEAASICAGHGMDRYDFRWIKDFRSRQSCHDSLRR